MKSMITVFVLSSAVASATRPQLDHADLLGEGGPLYDAGSPPLPRPASASNRSHPSAALTLQDSKKEHLISVTSRNREHAPSQKNTSVQQLAWLFTPSAP